MVAKLCSRSHGQPSGSRRRRMISSRSAISRLGLGLLMALSTRAAGQVPSAHGRKPQRRPGPRQASNYRISNIMGNNVSILYLTHAGEK